MMKTPSLPQNQLFTEMTYSLHFHNFKELDSILGMAYEENSACQKKTTLHTLIIILITYPLWVFPMSFCEPRKVNIVSGKATLTNSIVVLCLTTT